METCKECLYIEVCSGFTPTDLDRDVFDYCRKGITEEIPDIEKRCSSFKNAADVVPRAVITEIFAEIQEIFNRRIAFYTDMKSQAVLFFEEKYAETMITNCTIYLRDIAELKKKWTESER